MDKFEELTELLIDESEKNLVGFSDDNLTLIDLFRKYFDIWTRRLFPLWEIEGYRAYDRLADLLNSNGREISSQTISVYLNRIRKERNMNKLRKRK